jgi:FixJ family two-component response regulator
MWCAQRQASARRARNSRSAGRICCSPIWSWAPNPPTLVVSGYLDAALSERLLRLPGIVGTLAKPFDLATLEARIGEALAVAQDRAHDRAEDRAQAGSP